MPSVLPKPLYYLYHTYVFANSCKTISTENRQRPQHVKFSRSCTLHERPPRILKGLDYLKDPKINKGLAFTLEERQALGIHGLLAPAYRTQEQQVDICNQCFDRYDDPLNKYLFLSDLLEYNQRLFYSLLNTHVEKFLPIVYTPVVGLACQKFGFVYSKPKGLFVSIKDKGNIAKIISHWPMDKVRAICVTDGGRILGLGDLGANGMGIPIGKLCLYTALAGVKPDECLPVTLDVGTNNKALMEDPFYIGLRQKRVSGAEYFDFIEEFMEACVNRYGKRLLIQFEDFALENAVYLLDKYKDKYCTFNDDIQGTAAAIVAGVFSAIRIQKGKISDNIFLFFGAGSAGTGIAYLLIDAMKEEGLSEEQAHSKIYMFDVNGLLSNSRQGGVPAHAKAFGRDAPFTKDLQKAVMDLKATCLIGTSTKGGTFTPDVLKSLSKNCERPIIFALSNPTHKAECSPQQAYDNTEGRCIYASGSPFPPVNYNGKTYQCGQGNNSYIFPGVGLGIIASRASRVNDKLFLISAKTVAKLIKEDDLSIGRIYPSLKGIRSISFQIAKDIVTETFKDGTAGVCPEPKDLDELLKKNIYQLEYPNYCR